MRGESCPRELLSRPPRAGTRRPGVHRHARVGAPARPWRRHHGGDAIPRSPSRRGGGARIRKVKCVEADLGDRDAIREAVKGQDVNLQPRRPSAPFAGRKTVDRPRRDLPRDPRLAGGRTAGEPCREAGLLPALGSPTAMAPAGRRMKNSCPIRSVSTPSQAGRRTVHASLRAPVRLRFAVARLTNPRCGAAGAYGLRRRQSHDSPGAGRRDAADYGAGRQLRDYLYIDDAVGALLRLGETCEATVASITSAVGSGTARGDGPANRPARGSGRLALVPGRSWPRIETGDFVAGIARIRRESDGTARVARRRPRTDR